MAWLGSTDTSGRDVFKRVAAHISSSTNHGMALVTDSSGGLASSSDTETELSTLSGSTSNIQAQITGVVSNMRLQLDALDALQPTVTAGSLDISHVHGLRDGLDAKQATIGDDDLEIAHVAGLNTALNQFIPWGGVEITDIPTLQTRLGARVL